MKAEWEKQKKEKEQKLKEHERMQKDDRYIDLKNKIKAVLKGNKEPENYYEETKIDNKGKILAFVPRKGRKEKK